MRIERPAKAPLSVIEYIEFTQEKGRYTFERTDALNALGASDETFQKAARRLAIKRRLISPRRGFYVIVPIEYRTAGAPPPDWFIDALMKFQELPYYVGLLSAAALHGAAHQQPQEFQVVTDTPLRPTRAGRVRVRFFMKRHFEQTPTMQVKTETGSMRVSTPEATALDLVRYAASAGHLANVATVLVDLAEKINPRRLVSAAKRDVELSHVQRLGYLLDLIEATRLADPLVEWVASQRPRPVILRPGRTARQAKRDERWHVLVNDSIEVDR
jgi:predicted transcriptional regulator of viral defense system